jgi:glutamate-5-semialdehyde dehydrogenase
MTGTAASSIARLGGRARDAARELAEASTATKDAALHAAAELLEARAADILEANARDVERAGQGRG